MGLLTIGAFAKASRLSQKALRLYDELGLLAPARVDPVTGYRLYAPEQLEQARLVAWLRRLGMPLSRIQHVCKLDAASAAQEIRAFWVQVETDTTPALSVRATRMEQAKQAVHDIATTRSPTTTPWCSRWSTKDASARQKPPPTPGGPC